MESDKASNQLEDLLARGEKIISSNVYGPPSVRQWRNAAIEWLKTHLPASNLVDEAILVKPPTDPLNYSGRGLKESDRRGVQKLVKVLLQSRDLIPSLRRAEVYRPTPSNAGRVFVVHGRDEALKSTVARLLERLGLEPIILHEQPNRGRTIIEKFTDHADVSFAVVLLTGDDRGGLASEDTKSYRLRARQNVILELGYFLGRLGRRRVVAICQNGVDVPSDYHGVLFLPYDSVGAWRFELAKELKDAGLKIDLNTI